MFKSSYASAFFPFENVAKVVSRASGFNILTNKKLDGVYFAVISFVCRNLTYDICQYIVVEYVHHVHLFST